MESKTFLRVLIGIIIATIGGCLVTYGWQLRNMEIMAMKGEIIPFEVDPNRSIEIQIGGIHVITTLDQLSEGFNLTRYVNLGFDYPFQIRLKERKFLTSIEIRNMDGEIVAKIVDNQWVVNSNPVIARDRNYNAYAFEVIDSDLIPVIQVVFTAHNKMYLGGLFYVPNGRMLVTPNVTIFGPSSEDISENIERIFVYPSEQHLGEMVNQPRPIMESEKLIFIGVILSILGTVFSSGSWIQGKRKKAKQRTK